MSWIEETSFQSFLERIVFPRRKKTSRNKMHSLQGLIKLRLILHDENYIKDAV